MYIWISEKDQSRYFICFSTVLFPESPGPKNSMRLIRFQKNIPKAAETNLKPLEKLAKNVIFGNTFILQFKPKSAMLAIFLALEQGLH